MKKLAIFVEGYTEVKFILNLIDAIFNANECAIHTISLKGGTTIPITVVEDRPPTATQSQANYYILIYNCGGDGNIGSYIRDQRNSLISAGYYKIIGFQDLYPRARNDEHKLRQGLNFKLPQLPIPTVFVISIMEIEAWFLAETTHFQKICPGITNESILSHLGFDLSVGGTEQRNHPAEDLHNIYQLCGKEYKKEAAIIDRTINALDFAIYYLKLENSIPQLKTLIGEIESIFN